MKKFYAVTLIFALFTIVSFGFIVKGLNQNDFWTEAAQSGMTEVRLGNLALQNSQNEEIRKFAEKMVADHTTINDELKTLAASKNVTLPTDINAAQKASMEKLSELSGTDFDRQFISQMVIDHEAAVTLFQKQADSGTDADVKAFAAKNLPTLREHLSMARMVSGRMNNMNSNSNSNMMMNSNESMNSNRNINSNSNSNMNSNQNMNSNTNSNSNMDSNRNRNTNFNSNVKINGNVNINGM